jgi:hypothetical protein
MKYKRSVAELKRHATLYWPTELAEKEQSTSVIPKLIATQDKFISVLDVSDSTPDSWKLALGATRELYANLFLKHLMVLADVGGEPLQRIKAGFRKIFPTGKMAYGWRGRLFQYKFKAIPTLTGLTNKILFVDGKGFHIKKDLDPAMEDVIMLILHGAAAKGNSIPDIVRERCVIGSLMGEKAELEKFVKQRYIWVSRITGGATANTMGQIAQDYVKELLSAKLPDWKILRNGSIPGISQNAGDTDITFDIVACSPDKTWFAIEVSFQFTTNSVIERKAGQADARAKLLHAEGHKIAYVVDGAGNFARKSALGTICRNSDCTVAFTPQEIDFLVSFLVRNVK